MCKAATGVNSMQLWRVEIRCFLLQQQQGARCVCVCVFFPFTDFNMRLNGQQDESTLKYNDVLITT